MAPEHVGPVCVEAHDHATDHGDALLDEPIGLCHEIEVDWKRPDLLTIRGGIVADGLGCAVGGLAGAIGMSTAPSLVGVSHGSGATSRSIAFACAAILLLLALLPKYAALFLLLPSPVIGAAVTFTASFMIVSGIEIILSRSIDLRGTFVVGISTLVALARGLVPDYFTSAPTLLRSVAGSMLSLGVVTALALNALFRLGATRKVMVAFEGSPASLDASSTRCASGPPAGSCRRSSSTGSPRRRAR